MLNEEQDLVKSLTATLSSFKEDPSIVGRQRGKGEEPSAHHPGHDPDVWPPPTPVEARLVAMEGKISVSDSSLASRIPHIRVKVRVRVGPRS